MLLKKLQLLGFKTFADKTDITFGSGLTAVVGPNGSGKSNIVDAILWVLGEQNPRAIRGLDGKDVIFAGSQHRRPLNLADVQITLDNTDQSLPIQHSEVMITRRLFRSGESQYLINNRQCRLKDIVDLLLDTGSGRGAYAFVGQGDVDAVLSATPEERRSLFEEAAGIKKYRVRKQEALRKLEQAETNLQRVYDIMSELESEREPLSEQADLARRYRELTARLRQIETGLLVWELQKTEADQSEVKARLDEGSRYTQQNDLEIETLEQRSDELARRMSALEADLDAARNHSQSCLSALDKSKSELILAQERCSNAERVRLELERDREQHQSTILILNNERTDLRQRLETATGRRNQVQETVMALENDLKSSERLIQELETLLQQEHEQQLKSAQDETAMAAQIATIRERHRTLETEKSSLASRKGDLEQKLQLSTQEKERLSGENDVITKEIIQLKNTADELSERRDDLVSRIAIIERQRSDRLHELTQSRARLNALSELQRSFEGLYAGVRAVLSAARKGELAGRYELVADLVTIPEGYRTAIEVALGGNAQDIVCPTEADAERAIEMLRAKRAGRATFLPMDALKPTTRLPADNLNQLEGAVGIAADLIQFQSQYRPVMELLLGRVLIAADLKSATRIRRQLNYGKIVTLKGEVLLSSGSITGGEATSKSQPLIGRKGEMDDLRHKIGELDLKDSESLQELGSLREEAAGVLERLKQLEQQYQQHKIRKERLETELKSVDREIGEGTQALAQHSERLSQVHREYDQIEAELAQLTVTDDAVAEQGEPDISVATEVRARLQKAQAERDANRRLVEEALVQLARFEEQIAGLQRELEINERRQQEMNTTGERYRVKVEENEGVYTASRCRTNDLQAQIEEQQELANQANQAVGKLAGDREEMHRLNSEIRQRIRAMSEQRTATMQECHRLELLLARYDAKLQQITERLSEEYGIEHEAAMTTTDIERPDDKTVSEISRLRREIKQLGEVNTGAVEEYERLSERLTFLTDQRDDLEKAKHSLSQTIREIDENTRGVFLETFQAVSEEFQRLFERLFSGGQAKLVLTKPDQVLETGVEVMVQPPGKKSQHLTLLSGGERSLTAVALLFSFLTVRPAPFCVFDEVDAPMDGENIDKYCQLLKEFSEKSQIVVITHNPATMEASPRWYGITMQEPGVSRVISYAADKSKLFNGYRPNGNGSNGPD